MMRDEAKKTLFILGMDQTMEQIQKAFGIRPDYTSALQIEGPVITEPYGDIMREIVLSVYEKNIENIFIVGSKGKPAHAGNKEEIVGKIYEKKELQEQIEVVDYLFKFCMPEFPETSVHEWLTGCKTGTDGVETSVQMIRNHPLIPESVNVRGIVIDKSTGNLSELKVS